MLTLEKKLSLFWNKVNKTDSCWIWNGLKNSAKEKDAQYIGQGV
jgi:hypothetical protein